MTIRSPITRSYGGVSKLSFLLAALIVLGVLVCSPPALGSRQLRVPPKAKAFPTGAQIARARHFARSRQGIVSFTVVDSLGRWHSLDGNRQFVSASVVKAMLLTCFLNTKAIDHEPLTATDRSELRAMITVSDNDAANWVYSPYKRFARALLSSIASWESWGIPQVARSLGWKVFFKGGWRSTVHGQLIHQVARLERRNKMIVICVMTDGDPSQSYGEETIAGITRSLLRQPRRARTHARP
jgi:hypothetical protein